MPPKSKSEDKGKTPPPQQNLDSLKSQKNLKTPTPFLSYFFCQLKQCHI